MSGSKDVEITIQDISTLMMTGKVAIPGGKMLNFKTIDFSDKAQQAAAETIRQKMAEGLPKEEEEDEEFDDEVTGPATGNPTDPLTDGQTVWRVISAELRQIGRAHV